MEEGVFSLLGHLCQAKLETLAEGLRHRKGSTRPARGEVSPDLALGHRGRVEPKALDRTCSFMTKAPGASSLAGVAQRKRIQPVFRSQTASCLADLLSCLFSLLLLSPAQTWSDTSSLLVRNNLTNIYLAFCT